MSELGGSDTSDVPQDGQDAVPASRTTVPPGPASEGLSKAGISAMQGILEPEPIIQKEWDDAGKRIAVKPKPVQLEPEKITQAGWDAAEGKTSPAFDEDPISPAADTDFQAEGEGAVESPVKLRG